MTADDLLTRLRGRLPTTVLDKATSAGVEARSDFITDRIRSAEPYTREDLDRVGSEAFVAVLLDALRPECEAIARRLTELEATKDGAYTERNQLVAALSKLYPSHLCRHDENDVDWSRDWLNIVCIHAPVGQLTWHLHDSQMPLFAHLQQGENHWDGHTTPEKYQRLAWLTADSSRVALRQALQALREWLEGEKDAASRTINMKGAPAEAVHAATGLHASYRATLAKLDALMPLPPAPKERQG